MGIASGNSTVNTTLLEALAKLPEDTGNVIYAVSNSNQVAEKEIEIVSYLPARLEADIILGYVTRWREVQKYFNKPLRVYAWSYQPDVEKYILKCLAHNKDILVTMLPIKWRK